jgi:hypothetical protein
MRSFARVLLLLLFALGSACEPTAYRPCPSTHTDPTKQLYQEVLTELIEQGLMHAYLPAEDRARINFHFQDAQDRKLTPTDSLWLRYHLVLFQHRLYQDSARFQTFYLNTRRYSLLANLPATFPALQAYPKSTLAAWLTAIAPHQEQASLEQLRTVQQRMQPADFELCTAFLRPAERFGSPEMKEGVGLLTLSDVVFNATQDQALLAYAWQCGPNCGYGSLLWVENVNGHWRIKQEQETWIS